MGGHAGPACGGCGFGVGLLQHAVEDAFFKLRKRRIAVHAGPWQVNALVQRDLAVFDQPTFAALAAQAKAKLGA